MAYTTPRTWVSGEVVTAALLNTHLRDNMIAIADCQNVYSDTSATAWTPSTGYADIGVQLILPAGKYTVEADGAFDTSTGGVINYFARIQDTTNTVTLDEIFVRCTNNIADGYHLYDDLTIAGSTTVKLQLKVETVSGTQLTYRNKLWARPLFTFL